MSFEVQVGIYSVGLVNKINEKVAAKNFAEVDTLLADMEEGNDLSLFKTSLAGEHYIDLMNFLSEHSADFSEQCQCYDLAELVKELREPLDIQIFTFQDRPLYSPLLTGSDSGDELEIWQKIFNKVNPENVLFLFLREGDD